MTNADQLGNTLSGQLVGIQDTLMGLNTQESVLKCSTTNNQSALAQLSGLEMFFFLPIIT